MSKSGRFVAFASLLEGLVSNDPTRTVTGPLWSEIFVKDRTTGNIEVVSGTNSGVPVIPAPNHLTVPSLASNGCVVTNSVIASHPAISNNGRYVAFTSDAVNIVAGDTNDTWDVFVHDRKLHTTVRASVATDGTEGDGGSGNAFSSVTSLEAVGPRISGDGRYVSFISAATNLVEGDENEDPDIFMHDLDKGRTIRASVANDGSEIPHQQNHRGGFAMTRSGRYIAFMSTHDLAPDEASTVQDPLIAADINYMYVRDLKKTTTETAGLDTSGRRLDANALDMSDDGRFISYWSRAADAVPNDTNRQWEAPFPQEDIFVYDRKTQRTERVTVSSAGEEVHESSYYWAGDLSADGRFIVYPSYAAQELSTTEDQRCARSWAIWTSKDPCVTDLDVYRHDRKTGAVERVSLGAGGGDLSCPEDRAIGAAISVVECEAVRPTTWDGRLVAFMSQAENIVDGDSNSAFDVFVRDLGPRLGTGENKQASAGEAEEETCIEGICLPICILDICIPPRGAVSASDAENDMDERLSEEGADLYGAWLAYRPQERDLFAGIELERMPQVAPGALSPLLYGLRIEIEDRTYEVRATSLLGGTFGLFDCTGPRPMCSKVADLRGGYGTSGMRIVISIPLEAVGLQKGGDINSVTAIAALGSYLSGATEVLDTVKIK